MTTETNKMLGQCHTCNGIVSRKAKSCPHCGEGRPYRPKMEPPAVKLVWGLLVLLGLIITIGISADPATDLPDRNGGYPERTSRKMCLNAIRGSIQNPSTLKIHGLTGYGTNINAAGVRLITQSFSAKNGFGLELTYEANCTVTPAGNFTINITQRGG